MILYRRATTNGSPVPYGPRIDAYFIKNGKQNLRRVTEEVNYCLLFICLVVFATIILRMVFRVKGEDMNRTFVFVVLH